MAGVGDKAPAHLLSGLEAVGEVIKFFCQLGQLVPSHRLKPMAIFPFSHNTDGPEQGRHAGRQHLGEKGAHHQRNRSDHQRYAAQVLLKVEQQRPLGLIHFQNVNRPDDDAPVHNGEAAVEMSLLSSYRE